MSGQLCCSGIFVARYRMFGLAKRPQSDGKEKVKTELGCDGCYDARDHCRLITKGSLNLGPRAVPLFTLSSFWRCLSPV